jgi:hypothetical protein
MILLLTWLLLPALLLLQALVVVRVEMYRRTSRWTNR